MLLDYLSCLKITGTVILVADIILTYFQDKFGYTHYNILIGDNGLGKNSALLFLSQLGYRVFYITAGSGANYFTRNQNNGTPLFGNAAEVPKKNTHAKTMKLTKSTFPMLSGLLR